MDEESPRTRMVRSAGRLVRQYGVRGVALRQIVEHAGAPRGSLQTYFPNGRSQLIAEGVELAIAETPYEFDKAMRAPNLEQAVEHMLRPWKQQLLDDDFEAGCPNAAIVVDGVDDPAIRDRPARAFRDWQGIAATVFRRFGLDDDTAGRAALAMVAVTEGAIVLSRARGDLDAFDAVKSAMTSFAEAAVDDDRTGGSAGDESE